MEIKPWGLKGSCYNDAIHCSPKFAHYFQAAIEMLTENIFSYVVTNVAFICLADMDACRVARELAENREIILLSERLLPKNSEKANSGVVIYFNFVVLHELAHAYLEHKSPRYSGLSQEENNAQEEQADSLALEWYNDYIDYMNNPSLKKLSIELVNELREESLKKLELLNA